MNRFGEGNRRQVSFAWRKQVWMGAHESFALFCGATQTMHTINEDYRKKSQDLYKQDNITLREYKSQLLALQKDKKSKCKIC